MDIGLARWMEIERRGERREAFKPISTKKEKKN